MYKVIIHKKAKKFLKSRRNDEQKLISTKIVLLKENPFNHKELDIKKLKGVENVFRLRIGKIRIIYQILKNELLVLVIAAKTRSNNLQKKID